MTIENMANQLLKLILTHLPLSQSLLPRKWPRSIQ
jgi:hypothetical protein